MQSVDFELRPGVFVRDFERQSPYLAPQMNKTYLKVPKLAAIMILQQICQVSLGRGPPQARLLPAECYPFKPVCRLQCISGI